MSMTAYYNEIDPFAAAWLRDIIQVVAGNQLAGGAMLWQLFVFSPLAALSTAVAALVARLVFRGWLDPR